MVLGGFAVRTCKYCGTELEYYGRFEDSNQYFCDFCDLLFPEEETSFDRKRKKNKPRVLNPSMTLSVKEMLKTDTITLFYSLKETNSFWYFLKTSLENFKQNLKKGNLDQNDPEITKQLKEMKHEYIQITKTKFAIENILRERTGFLPEKITEEFLAQITVEGEKFEEKPMYIYIK